MSATLKDAVTAAIHVHGLANIARYITPDEHPQQPQSQPVIAAEIVAETLRRYPRFKPFEKELLAMRLFKQREVDGAAWERVCMEPIQEGVSDT